MISAAIRFLTRLRFQSGSMPFEKLIYLSQEQLNQARQPKAVNSN